MPSPQPACPDHLDGAPPAVKPLLAPCLLAVVKLVAGPFAFTAGAPSSALVFARAGPRRPRPRRRSAHAHSLSKPCPRAVAPPLTVVPRQRRARTPSNSSLRHALEPFTVIRSPKVEENSNPLIYHLHHVLNYILNLVNYCCNIETM